MHTINIELIYQKTTFCETKKKLILYPSPLFFQHAPIWCRCVSGTTHAPYVWCNLALTELCPGEGTKTDWLSRSPTDPTISDVTLVITLPVNGKFADRKSAGQKCWFLNELKTIGWFVPFNILHTEELWRCCFYFFTKCCWRKVTNREFRCEIGYGCEEGAKQKV